MSLFVGNISRNVDVRDLEKAFKYYGSCTINPRGSYGFVEYKNESDAEDAKEALTGKNMGGLPLIIEWSKRSGRFDPRESRRDRERYYKDRERRHGGGRKNSRSRSDSRSRRRRYRSRSRDRRRERSSPRYTPERSKSKSGSRKNRRSRSRSPRRDRSRS
mmetsp:Transcript_64590/g.97317  ORF Transcript_64590/g.97317 Transcript_64590/m.97317 type:complete len:160 (+) Transcript_64590:85-564(+)